MKLPAHYSMNGRGVSFLLIDANNWIGGIFLFIKVKEQIFQFAP